MFEPRHLKAYLALVKCMHFGRAAEMLGISQPTLSQQIRMLEEAVGAPLINRSNRTMELTPVGRVFAEDAQQILTLMERAKRRVGCRTGNSSESTGTRGNNVSGIS